MKGKRRFRKGKTALDRTLRLAAPAISVQEAGEEVSLSHTHTQTYTRTHTRTHTENTTFKGYGVRENIVQVVGGGKSPLVPSTSKCLTPTTKFDLGICFSTGLNGRCHLNWCKIFLDVKFHDVRKVGRDPHDKIPTWTCVAVITSPKRSVFALSFALRNASWSVVKSV